MAVTPACFVLESRRVLSLKPVDEIVFRSAARTAYYGAYHAALSLWEEIGDTPTSTFVGGVHKLLSDSYSKYAIKDNEAVSRRFRAVGIKLLHLHGQRVKADYGLDASFSLEDASSVVSRAESLLAELKELSLLAALDTKNPDGSMRKNSA